MRIALAVEGTRGDVAPMLDLADAFRSAGHTIRLCGPGNFEQVARERGYEFREIGRDTKAFLTEVAGSISSRGLAANRAQKSYIAETIDRQFTRLPEATRDADLVLGAGVQIGAASAAELHGIPYRYIAFCPAMFPSSDHAPVFLPTQSLPRWANRLAWWLGLRVIGGLVGIKLNRERRKLGLPRVRDAIDHILSARPLLASDAVLGPLPPDCPIEVEMLGCLHSHRPEPLPGKLESFLNQGPAPIYLGFGSMTDPDPTATTQLMLRAVEAAGCRALLSEGWAGLGEGGLPENVMRVGSVSHTALFPRVAAVVHHGGAGTTTSAARAGVPQVVIPHLLDQFYWGKRMSQLGLAPPAVPRAALTAEKLARSIDTVLGNEILCDRAREVAARIAPPATPQRAAQSILAAAASA